MNLLGPFTNLFRSEIPRTPAPHPEESPFADDAEECDCSGYVSFAEWDAAGNRLPPEETVRRALLYVGRGRYKLGRGGRRQRNRPGFGWVSTSTIVADATGAHRLWRAVPIAQARPGDVVAYPSRYAGGVRVAIGHTGRIVAVNGPGWDGLDVVDCAARKGAAIGHRDGTLWGKKGGVVARAV